jgi:hypothetical protein
MVKILLGLVVAFAIALGGFFGFEFYVQHRVAAEVEAKFEQIRATGSKASHGKVTYDLLSRTITVADIAAESAAQPPVSVKIASFTASGVSQPDAARFSAESIEATDVEVDRTMAFPAGWSLTYKAPKIAVKDYSGPAGPQRPLVSSSTTDVYRFAFEHFAAVTASSITAPGLAATISFPGAEEAQAFDYTYSGLALRDIKDGRIAAATIEQVAFTANIRQNGKTEKIGGEFAGMAAYDVDSGAALAIFDPARANDDKYYQAYRQITAGAYTVSLPDGMRMRIDGITVDDVGLRPSKLQFPQLMAIIESVPPPGTKPTPAQTRDMLEKMAGIYEGLHVGNAEMRGLAMETPQGPLKLAAIRFNLENGKIGEFALEGLDARSPTGPVKVGRFALKSLDVANLMRTSALVSNPAQKPSPDQLFGLFLLLEGAEIKNLVAPYKDSTAQVNIEDLSLNWGQFVGPIPSKAHLTAKMSGPIDATNPGLKMLVAAGMDSVTMNADLGAAWTEGSRTFVLEPAMVELGGLLTASARVSLANVPREVFSTNPLQMAVMAAQIEAGTTDITLRDLGVVDLAVAQFARAHEVSPDAARRAIIENLRSAGATMATTNPDAMAITDALIRFIENPRGTLTVKLTPQGKVPAMQLVSALKTDLLAALARFQVEASTGR